MNSGIFRKAFWGFVGLGLIFNLVTDIWIYKNGSSYSEEQMAANAKLAVSADMLIILLLGVVFYIELSQRRKTEVQLKETVEKLRQTNLLLAQTDVLKTNLLKTTVHDLKNPLGSIRGFADLIHEEAGRESVVELAEYIQKISDKTLSMVNTLLQPKALAQGKTETSAESFNICNTLRDVAHNLRPQLQAKHQKLNLELQDSDFAIMGDSLKINDLFTNLISNASKFSPTKSEIRIRLYKNKDYVQIEIEDQGPGFTTEDLQKLFLPGEKLSARPTAGESSSGFGLFSAKIIAEQHHGSIEIQNRISNPGAHVTLRLPISNAIKSYSFDL